MTLGRYRILEKLGGGGMGEVYRAEDVSLRRHVAIKVLPPRLAGRADALERFEREAAAVGALNHPNIVTIHSIEAIGDRRLITMELIEGQTLHSLVPEDGLETERCLAIAIPLTAAIAAAHQRGITHRDIKPANIMVAGGVVKVVDFGLAKLRQSSGNDLGSRVPDPTLTREGQVLGTVPYMAPEQFQGQPADHRSDVFALGVVFYEMITGRHPFPGDTQPLVISSILRDPPAPIAQQRADLPPGLSAIVARCLEKAPEDRYQDAGALSQDLVALKQGLDSASILRSAGRAPSGSWRVAAVLAALLTASVGGVWLLSHTAPSTRAPLVTPPVTAASRQPTVAVLQFFNTARDRELDWLRDGLPDMFITDLSQSRNLRLVSADRIYGALESLDALGSARRLGADLVRRVAQETGADTVITGSFARLEDRIRIDVQVRDAETGEVRQTQARDGTGEASVFGLVDALSQFVRTGFINSADRSGPRQDQEVTKVTTASVQAYRFYTAGAGLHRQLKLDEAISMYQKALEIDPGFAMVYARLVSANIARADFRNAKRNATLAFEHAERLPERERGFIEGEYYSAQRATYPRAIAAFKQTIDRFPDHFAARRSLGHLYGYVERFEDALAQYLPAFEQAAPLPGIANAIAHMNSALGRFDAGYDVMNREIARHPDEWTNYMFMAIYLTSWQRLDEAASSLDRAEALRPGETLIVYGRWRWLVLHDELDAAARSAASQVASGNPSWQHTGRVQGAFTALFQGREADADALFAAASRMDGDPLRSSIALCRHADLLLLLGKNDAAFAIAARAEKAAPDDWSGWEGIYLQALSRQAAGERAAAERLRARFVAKIPDVDALSIVERRYLHHLDAQFALARGDIASAQTAVHRALALLPPRGIHWDWARFPDHIAIWDTAARVAERAGDPDAALGWYRRIADSHTEHQEDPVRWVRSLYHTARLLAAAGDLPTARRYAARFLGLWEAGTMARPWVAEAQRMLGS